MARRRRTVGVSSAPPADTHDEHDPTASRVTGVFYAWLQRRLLLARRGDATAPGARGTFAKGRVVNALAWMLSLWFGCGLLPYAPGTAGTLGALPLYWWVRPYGLLPLAATAGVVTVAGVWSSSRVARASGVKDPQFICVDEVAGVLVTLLAAPVNVSGVLVGVLLFRLFDWLKPFPARDLERLPGGLGIVCDDLAAGAWGAVVLLALRAAGLM